MHQPSSPSWRYLASTSAKFSFSSVKGFLGHSTGLASHATWRTWATQKIRGKGRTNNETLTLFPGWAARRYLDCEQEAGPEPVPFEVEVYTSGYAVSCREREQASRSQRYFIRFAKSFAALPRIEDQASTGVSASAEELLGPPGQASDELQQAQILDQQLQHAKSCESDSEASEFCNGPSSPTLALPSPSHSLYLSSTLPPKELKTSADVIQKLHYNLESRLQPFWSSTLASRTVRLHLFALPNGAIDNAHDNDYVPLATKDVTTSVDGSFNARFRVKWEDLTQHPRALHIAFGEQIQEHDLVVVAELLPPPLVSPTTPTPTSAPPFPPPASRSTPSSISHSHFTPSYTSSPSYTQPPYIQPQPYPESTPTSASHSHSRSHPHLHTLHTFLTSLTSPHTPILTSSATASSHLRVPITHPQAIRIISDIDDTIKQSGVPEGARAVFHNVFVKELKDGVIPGMGEWYSGMWDRGVRFHYVSNGPYEYLSVLREFFEISKLPAGSIKLKSYAGRSLLSGLLSAPAARKRAGVVDILESFPDARFILIGDSGEQDLELYADLARERPTQILAVFIRDAEEQCYAPIDDPTGWAVVEAGPEPPLGSSPTNTSYSSSSSVSLSTPSSPVHTPSSSPRSIVAPPQQTTPKLSQIRKRVFSNPMGSGSGTVSPRRRTSMGIGVRRTSAGGLFTPGPLTEEPVEGEGESMDDAETPRQPQCAAFSGGSQIGPPSVTVSAPSLPPPPSLSAPLPVSTQPSGYITTPPPPVPPLAFSSHTPYNRNMSAGNGGSSVKRSATDALSQLNISSRYNIKSRASTRSSGGGSSESESDGYSKLGSLSASFAALGARRTPGSGSDSGLGSAGIFGRGSGGAGNVNINIGDGGRGSPSNSSSGSVGGGEKKRAELQMRVYRARTQMPEGVPLRVFRHPVECGEDVDVILGRMVV
ncbi:hypothetical protein P691DRAFT_791824 [Macrolepiota fuliginosa MF-IS2]|uniref:Phosphatidate phosphatase APP1 catalytic domain-containing protein n=1 Tax=Macrolepiota fuliginosa MF-IS2 TaxID=1400762 RepID=A0A9P6C2I1_9AGAR|nr:hypothetical protein P691DRAFT_791824 [Macrolepiota fuliginosa MF-IS2]